VRSTNKWFLRGAFSPVTIAVSAGIAVVVLMLGDLDFAQPGDSRTIVRNDDRNADTYCWWRLTN